MEHYPNLFVIAGTGQNSGKTTLACEVIKACSSQHQIAAIKATPHKYPVTPGCIVLEETPDYTICEETNRDIGKDSSSMLRAGAVKSFFVMCADDQIERVFKNICKMMPDILFICESGGLARFIKPGLFLMLTRKDHQQIKPGIEELIPLADHFINSDEVSIDIIAKRVSVKKNSWHFN